MSGDRDLEERLLDILDARGGQDDPIGMGELFERLFNRVCRHLINDTSPLRLVIRKMRREGVPICSTSDKVKPGYWLAKTPEELAEFTTGTSAGAWPHLTRWPNSGRSPCWGS